MARRLSQPLLYDPVFRIGLKVLVVFAAGYAGYQFGYQPVVVRMMGLTASGKASVKPMLAAAAAKHPPPKASPPAKPAVASQRPSAPPPSPSPPRTAPRKPVVVAQRAPAPPRPPPPPKPMVVQKKPTPPAIVKPKPVEPKPEVAAAKAPAAPETAAKPKSGFRPPVYPPIEEVTKNWTEIPPGVFSQHLHVLIQKDVEFKMGTGSVTVKAGSTAVAVAQQGNALIVAPSEDSPGRGEIPLEATDLKKAVSDVYDRWKITQTESLRKAYETGQTAGPDDGFGKPKAAGPVRNDKPSRNADGSYPILVESMRLTQVREITPQNIKKWGDVERRTIDGQEYWVVPVSYTTKTIVGDFNVEAEALVYGGKVKKWVYTGSGEVVP